LSELFMAKTKAQPGAYRKPTTDQVLTKWKLKPLERVLALLIRRRTNAEGFRQCHKSELASEACAKAETVDRALRRMKKLGVLQIESGEGKKAKASYRLHHCDRVYRRNAQTDKTKPQEPNTTGSIATKPVHKPLVMATALNKLPHPSQPAEPEIHKK
jgi:hypothetical protein